ncbi:hypothetical protein RB653_007707 [Dictyostelium firmibasis]|uniref:DNA-directed RNA polymerase n=1 Tax=Dictyostelium firmibasis TaxID=79012 RepID=A0AAN7TW27_9MYCE
MIRISDGFKSISKFKLQSFNSFKYSNNGLNSFYNKINNSISSGSNNNNNNNNIKINEYSTIKNNESMSSARFKETFIPEFFNTLQLDETTKTNINKSNLKENREKYLQYMDELAETKEKLRKLEETFIEDIAKLKKARIVAEQYLKDGETLMDQDVNWESDMKAINEKEKNLRKLETLLEFEAIEDAVLRYRELMEDSTGKSFMSNFKSVREVMMQWNEGLMEKVEAALNKENQKQPWVIITKKASIQKSVLKALNILVGKCVLNNNIDVSIESVREYIGISVYAEYKASVIKKEEPSIHKKLSKLIPASALQKFYHISNDNIDVVTLPPDPVEVKSIGQFFVDQLFLHCKIQENLGEDGSRYVPAFSIESRYTAGMRTTKVVPHVNIFKLINDGHSVRETGGARLYPMVIKPLPWLSPVEGPYLHYKVPIMRTNGSSMQLRSLADADLSLVYRSLNVLGETPWKINRDIYEVIMSAWESGGNIGDIPKRTDNEYPEVPEDVVFNFEARREYYKKEQKIKALNYNLHSLRCDTLYKLDVAKKFLDHTLYFPHNIDFRGRSYPIPPHLNHLGSDFCRSLLKFEKSLPLGEKGFYWLKIHVANLFGVDKIPLEDRVIFTEKNMENIFDSVDNPLGGNRWWLKADYPWQTLGACMEITKAIRSGDPSSFESNLPVHQDGTCNGLQHYAALGGDVWGAEKVNLLPSDRPQDVYSGVAQLVSKLVDKDAEDGNEIAKFFVGKVDRKLVKQTVMTSVYGVTYIGAREQIENAILEKFKDCDEINDDRFLFKASSYIARHTFSSLNDMFVGARSIMKWMSECSSLIAKSGECVSWVTPLGLPVVQPYRKGGRYSIRTLECEFIVVHDDELLPVDTNRQRSAFPPNFIHSLDSTHMFLTALSCDDKGITYSSVHDSYWTHACTVDNMNEILRNEFVELHKQPILERLLEWFQTKYPNLNFPPIPKKGQLDISRVKESKYFFH